MADGLEEIARAERVRRFGTAVRVERAREAGVINFEFTGDLRALLSLKTVLSVALVRHYAVPRPKALLGDQHFRLLLGQIATARALAPAEAYGTLHISAAGSDSSVMGRLKEELAKQTGLTPVPPSAHEGGSAAAVAAESARCRGVGGAGADQPGAPAERATLAHLVTGGVAECDGGEGDGKFWRSRRPRSGR
ncbi:MAG: hypothetical protein U0841_25240 [Chloroflexia bacterium]